MALTAFGTFFTAEGLGVDDPARRRWGRRDLRAGPLRRVEQLWDELGGFVLAAMVAVTLVASIARPSGR